MREILTTHNNELQDSNIATLDESSYQLADLRFENKRIMQLLETLVLESWRVKPASTIATLNHQDILNILLTTKSSQASIDLKNLALYRNNFHNL